MHKHSEKILAVTHRLFQRIAAGKYSDSILGDLCESYENIVKEKGFLRAMLWCFLQILTSLPSFLTETFYRSAAMFKNYVKIALRNIYREKIYSFINIFGLSIGIACCLLIYAFVENELSYDAFHTNIDRIFLTSSTIGSFDTGSTPGPFGKALVDEIPEIDLSVRIQGNEHLVKIDNNIVKANVLYADPAFFEMFDFELLKGNEVEALTNIRNVVLAEGTAQHYYGNEDPIGKIISIKLGPEYREFLVTGIAKEIPPNSSIQFEFLVPLAAAKDIFSSGSLDSYWGSYNFRTFVRTDRALDAKHLDEKMPDLIDKYLAESVDEGQNPQEVFGFLFHSFADYHLGDSGAGSALEAQSNPMYSYILSGIALFILLIACFNFTNLSIGRSSSRFKEIGMRKVLGAQKKQLGRQFMIESLLLAAIAFAVGIILSELFLPTFNSLSEKSLDLKYLGSPLTILSMFGLIVVVGVLTGSYPAFILSRLQTIEIFKGSQKIGGKNLLTRSLIIFQFSLSIVLIVSTLIMNRQQDFMKNKDLGFNKENVILFPTEAGRSKEEGDRVLEVFTNRFSDLNQVVAISGTSGSFDRGGMISMLKKPDGSEQPVYLYKVDYNFQKVLDFEMAQGRYFDESRTKDFNEGILLNEAFMKEFNIEDPVGKKLSNFSPVEGVVPTIIGVVKDYHLGYLKRQISPALLYLNSSKVFRYVLVRVTPGDVSGLIGELTKTWNELKPDQPFTYYFLDEDVNRRYKNEERWEKIISFGSTFAIIIACLGLFGLSNITVAKRGKEIGIRKILGARVSQLVGLINKEFLVLVVLGNIIAWPTAYFAMNKWLQNFAYRIDLGTEWFFVSTALVLIIALITISYQALKSALSNPADIIRYE